MSRRQFKAARAEQGQEPIEVEVGAEIFAVLLPLPALSFLEMVNEDASQAAQAFARFFSDAFGEEEYKRFSKAARSERLSFEDLGEIARFISEEATGRPTPQQSASADGQLSTSTGLPAAATSEG
jgi:hypothetical protein